MKKLLTFLALILVCFSVNSYAFKVDYLTVTESATIKLATINTLAAITFTASTGNVGYLSVSSYNYSTTFITTQNMTPDTVSCNSLGVTNNALIGGTLTVSGALSAASIASSGAISGTALSCSSVVNSGSSLVSSNLSVTGNTSLMGTLLVSGNTTVKNLVINGSVSGNMTLTGTMNITKLVTSSDIIVSGNAIISGNASVPSSSYFYIGDSLTNGSWRIGLSGINFVIERLEAAVWVIKYYITP